MKGRARAPAAVAVVAVLIVAGARPAAAHGIGGRADLPLPVWMVVYGAAAALVVSFAALAAFWPTAKLEGDGPERPFTVPPALTVVARAAGLAAFAVVWAAAALGTSDASANLAPVAVYVLFWVGLTLVSALVADVWRVLSPFDSLAALGSRLRRRAGRPEPARPYRLGQWPAVGGLLGFVWLELVHPHPDEPRVLAVAISAYTLLMLAGAAWWGRGWLREGDAFAAWFGTVAHMAPVGRGDDGRLRLRPPLVGLARLRPTGATIALVLVALGSTTFDGVTRTQFWSDLTDDRTGWSVVPLATAGLLAAIAVVTLAYLGAMQLTSRRQGGETGVLARAFAHSLVPIAVAYAVAHYFSLLVFNGQSVLALASDPLGRGWDVLGTAADSIDYGIVSTRTIAYVQAGAIVAGHVAGVVLAHDRALVRFPGSEATRSQYPLLAAMVLFTVGGLLLLLGA